MVPFSPECEQNSRISERVVDEFLVPYAAAKELLKREIVLNEYHQLFRPAPDTKKAKIFQLNLNDYWISRCAFTMRSTP